MAAARAKARPRLPGQREFAIYGLVLAALIAVNFVSRSMLEPFPAGSCVTEEGARYEATWFDFRHAERAALIRSCFSSRDIDTMFWNVEWGTVFWVSAYAIAGYGSAYGWVLFRRAWLRKSALVGSGVAILGGAYALVEAYQLRRMFSSWNAGRPDTGAAESADVGVQVLGVGLGTVSVFPFAVFVVFHVSLVRGAIAMVRYRRRVRAGEDDAKDD